MSSISPRNVTLIEKLQQVRDNERVPFAFFANANAVLSDAAKSDETRKLAESLQRLLNDFEWSKRDPNWTVFARATDTLLDYCLASLSVGVFPDAPLQFAREGLDSFLKG